jgi:predicted CXXCH cytochrome family protein
MRSPLEWFQDFSHKRSRYERPNCKWVCGHASEGWSCAEGPTPSGKCCATAECVPYSKDGRWHCTRPENRGGKCEAGPLPDGKCACAVTPCQPVLNTRARRGRAVWFASAFVFGSALLIFTSNRQNQMISPGGLSVHHAPLGSDCASCHSAADKSFGQWIAASVMSGGDRQSSLCLDCHSNFKQEWIQKPHSMPPAELAEITEQARQAPATSRGGLQKVSAALNISVPTDADGNLACATCHTEHQGAMADIRRITSQQCQTCHQRTFDSFAHGHPQFGKTTVGMKDVLDWDAFLARLSGDGSESPVIKNYLNALPADLRGKVQQAGFTSGNLKAEEKQAMLRVLNSEIHSGGLMPKGTAKSEREVRVALQSAFPDELSPGHSFPYQRRPSIAFNHHHHIAGGFGGMPNAPTDCLDCHTREGDNIGFRGFQQSCASCHTGQIVVPPEDKTTGIALVQIPELDIDSLRQKNINIGSYPSNAQGGVSFLTKLLVSGDSKYPQFESDLKLLASLPDWADLSEASSAQLEAVQRFALAIKRLYNESAKGGKEEIKKRILEATGNRASPDLIDYLLRPFPIETLKTVQARALPNSASESVEPGKAPITVATHPGADPVSYALLYQPKKHMDNYMQAWLTVLTQSKAAAAIVETSADLTKSFQACIICHSVEQNRDQTLSINWSALHRDPRVRDLTHFKHAPHLTMECQHCHKLEESVDKERFRSAFRRVNPLSFEPVFQTMGKETCVQCHTEQRAGDRCMLCHQYHIGVFDQRIPKIQPFNAPPPTSAGTTPK